MWLSFEILNPAFDYFFSLGATMAFIIAVPAVVISVFKI